MSAIRIASGSQEGGLRVWTAAGECYLEIVLLRQRWLRLFIADVTRAYHWNVLLSSGAVLMGLAWLAYEPSWLNALPHGCLMQRVAGVVCPGCGILRSGMALMRMDVWGAWGYHPAGVLLFGVLALQILLRSAALRGWISDLGVTRISRGGSALVLAWLLVVWFARLAG